MEYQIVDKKEAEDYGFVIEGPIAFLFDLDFCVAILGWNSLDRTWQFDTSVNEYGETWQFVETNIHEALAKAQEVTEAARKSVAAAKAAYNEAIAHAMEGALIKQGLIAS